MDIVPVRFDLLPDLCGVLFLVLPGHFLDFRCVFFCVFPRGFLDLCGVFFFVFLRDLLEFRLVRFCPRGHFLVKVLEAAARFDFVEVVRLDEYFARAEPVMRRDVSERFHPVEDARRLPVADRELRLDQGR